MRSEHKTAEGAFPKGLPILLVQKYHIPNKCECSVLSPHHFPNMDLHTVRLDFLVLWLTLQVCAPSPSLHRPALQQTRDGEFGSALSGQLPRTSDMQLGGVLLLNSLFPQTDIFKATLSLLFGLTFV